MRLPEYGANSPYLVDFIPITLKLKLLDSEEIRKMYVEKGLSAAQIAKHFRVARTVIFARLHDVGIKDAFTGSRNTNPENYRCHVAPYGFAIHSGKLVTNKRELRICRLVVELIQRQGKNHSEAARELTQRGLRNRTGNSTWDSKTIFNIYNRWKDKI